VDRAIAQMLDHACDTSACQAVSEALAVETGWPHGAYAAAVLPVLVVFGTLLAISGSTRSRVRAVAFRWLLALLLLGPAQQLLSRLYARTGPLGETGGLAEAYPSGAALLVALGWLGGGMVIAEVRPAWRHIWWTAATGALMLHAFARVVADKHWTTDIVGSFLLVLGVLALLAPPEIVGEPTDKSRSQNRTRDLPCP
jgi:hypothetical protein